MYQLTIKDKIDSAHKLIGYHGKCANIHGHTWWIEITVIGTELNPLGILMDFKDIKQLIIPRTIQRFDHQLLNDHKPFDKINPTAENLSKYVFEDIESSMLLPRNIKLKSVTIWESEKASCKYEK